MGTRAEAADLPRLQAAIAEVRSDTADVYRKSWLVVGHVENNPLVIDVLSCVSSPADNMLSSVFSVDNNNSNNNTNNNTLEWLWVYLCFTYTSSILSLFSGYSLLSCARFGT